MSYGDLTLGTRAGLGFGRDVGHPMPPLPSANFGQILAGSLSLVQIPVLVPGLPSVEDACMHVMRLGAVPIARGSTCRLAIILAPERCQNDEVTL